MNDHEFDRVFRDRLYEQSYRPRRQLWKQLRLEWQKRVAARQWRVICSAAMVVMVGVGVSLWIDNTMMSAGRTNGMIAARVMGGDNSPKVRRNAAAGHNDPVAGHNDPVAEHDDPVAEHDNGVVAGKNGPHEHDDAVVSGETRAARLKNEADGREERAVLRNEEVEGRDTGAAMTMSSGPVIRIGGGMGVWLPPLARVGGRAGVQPPVRAKAARVNVPERPHKDADPAWNGWSGEAYGSPDLPTQQFNFSWTAGFRVSRIFAVHYSITAGLQYSTINVQRGDWAAQVLYPARFTNLDLPVLLGYSTNGRRFRLSAYAGGYFNLLSHPSGSPGWPWPKRSGPSAYLGLDLNYVIRDGWSLFAQPYGRCLFSSGANSLFPGKIFTEGALIGVRYRLIQKP